MYTNSKAYYQIAMDYLNGINGKETNSDKAYYFFKKSIDELEHPENLNGMGNYYESKGEHFAAHQYHVRAAEKGSGESQLKVADSITYGLPDSSIEIDIREGIFWYALALHNDAFSDDEEKKRHIRLSLLVSCGRFNG